MTTIRLLSLSLLILSAACSTMSEEEKAEEIRKYRVCVKEGNKPYWFEGRLAHCLTLDQQRKDEEDAFLCNRSGLDVIKDKSGRYSGCSETRNINYIVN